MRYLVDAQLPRRLALRLRDAGYDALHTLDLPDGNARQMPRSMHFPRKSNAL
jgi:predicted nuclease of predicted toxin-antitoxin system